uniref:Uncharacterized protein n=1 Tax=Picea glauca TaxID=3330 RepID=A0A117NIY4_PICGL|nr:hypothetical protein ABT39_MTgene547 [Picea glauca]
MNYSITLLTMIGLTMKGSLLQGEIFPLYMDPLSYDIAGDPVP